MYAYLDGDNIGCTLNLLLNSGRDKEASHLSEGITNAIFKIAEYIKQQDDAELIIAGGDDILFCYKGIIDINRHLNIIKNIFTRFTGLTMSSGLGNNVQNAIDSLAESKKTKSENDFFYNSFQSTGKSIIPKDLPANLYIFIGSYLPDPYINVIAHCLAYYHSIESINLIDITHDLGRIEHQENKLQSLRRIIKRTIELLCEGRYFKKKFDGEQEEIKLSLAQEDIARYQKVLKQKIQTKVILYSDLEKTIERWKNDHREHAHIFDVTAALKSELVDIYTICRYRKVSTIYSFELLSERRTFDYRELIHELHHTKTYLYKCLAETLYTSNKLVVDESLVDDQRKLNDLKNQNNTLHMRNRLLIDTAAKDLSSIVAYLYILIAVVLFLIAIYFTYKDSNGWNTVEPITSLIVPGFIYIGTYIFQMIFDGGLKKANPFNVREQFKLWYVKRIEKFINMDK